jgi:hypothetical protein
MGIGSKFGILAETGNNIQTEGLVFYIDSSIKKSYPRTGTNVFNLASGSLTPTGSLKNDTGWEGINPTSSFIFDGTDDFIKSNYTGTIPSLSLWFKPNSTVTTSALGGVLIGFEDSGQYSGIYLGKVVGAISNELITIFSTASGNKSYYSQASGTINTDWHNLIISHTGTQYDIYLDSINVWSANYGGNVGIINATRFDIGTRILSNSVNAPFDGKIANIQVYNHSLSASDVLQNYNAGKDRFGL